MIEIKVTIAAPELAAAMNHLADSLSAGAQNAVKAIADNAPTVPRTSGAKLIDPAPVPATAKAPEQPNVVPFPAQTPVAAAPSPAPVAAPVPTPAPIVTPPAPAQTVASPSEKKYTFGQISAAGASLIDQNMEMVEKLTDLMRMKYGVAALTMLPESRYGELAADLISMGAVIKEES